MAPTVLAQIMEWTVIDITEGKKTGGGGGRCIYSSFGA